MFSGLILVCFINRGVVVLTVVVGVLILGLVDSQAVCRPIHFGFLVLIGCLGASIGNSVGLLLEVLADHGIGGKYLVLVIVNSFSVSMSTFEVKLPLHLFLAL